MDSMVRAHHVRLEGDLVNVVISILLLEGMVEASIRIWAYRPVPFLSSVTLARKVAAGSSALEISPC